MTFGGEGFKSLTLSLAFISLETILFKAHNMMLEGGGEGVNP